MLQSSPRKKKILYGAGERLFHAVVLFAVATTVAFGCAQPGGSLSIPYVGKVVDGVLYLSVYMFFYIGAWYVCIALMVLNQTLFPGTSHNAAIKAVLGEFDELDGQRQGKHRRECSEDMNVAQEDTDLDDANRLQRKL